MNILPFGGLGIWRNTYRKKKKRKVIMSGAGAVGGVGAAGGGGGGAMTSVGGAAGTAAPTSADGAAGVATDAPQVSGPGGDTENAEKFGNGTNINMSQNVDITNINMSTQDQMSLNNSVFGTQGGQESQGLDLQKLIELMMALMIMKTMSNIMGGGQ